MFLVMMIVLGLLVLILLLASLQAAPESSKAHLAYAAAMNREFEDRRRR